jgi:hypothetical protein
MVELVYLSPGESPPEASDEDRWLHIDANDEGGYYGTGWSRKPSGESVFYRSLAEDDVSLEAAIAAAMKWAEKYSVPKIWIQREPWNLDSR